MCPWWRHQMEIFSALLSLCEGNPPVTCGFPSQRPVTRSFDVFLYLRLNKGLSKQSRRRWSETPSCSSWPHCLFLLMTHWTITLRKISSMAATTKAAILTTSGAGNERSVEMTIFLFQCNNSFLTVAKFRQRYRERCLFQMPLKFCPTHWQFIKNEFRQCKQF